MNNLLIGWFLLVVIPLAFFAGKNVSSEKCEAEKVERYVGN